MDKECSKLWSMRPPNGQPTTNQATGQTTDRRVTVTDAAVLLGLSEDAVRSRLKRGTLRKEKGQDGTVFVVLDPDTATDQQSPTSDHPRTDDPTGRNDLLEDLRDQVEFLRQQLSEEREANRENRRIIAGLVQRVPELEAARESTPKPRESDLTAFEEPSGATTTGDRPVSQAPEQQRSWLYRFFFGP